MPILYISAGTVVNLVIYAIGVGLAVAGALGLAGAIEFDVILAAVLFVAGLAAVVAVHEYRGGPV